ncbi:Gamma-tubulin complex component 5 [Cytospora mali]|uniref:Spindle pole body component n=1 Tax=Cytospora mali TaxID=578113 RepID=A0A194ULK3_CYTMA|nr:Gamma-tubulin complex component 5 [Valsa mali var. pyri (nom. inval.)]
MAFLAELVALTDELVTVSTSTSPTSQPDLFGVYRESALRTIRNRNYLRTNQFAVQEQLRGLVERFSVVGRDGLSDALDKRLDALSSHSTKWTPEMLHLLLELSDQPVQKTKLGDLEHLHPPGEDPGPSLRWEDIAIEDGWTEDRGLWKNVDFADSSEDEFLRDSPSQASAESEDTSISSATQGQRTAKDLVLPPNHESLALENIKQSQAWRHAAPPRDESGRPLKTPISELQILRDVLFMLNGLQSDLFAPDCMPVAKYQLSDVSWDTYRALINSFAECGRTLLPLRKFCQTHQDIPLVQAFQDSVYQRLRAFDLQIASIQRRFVGIETDTLVSLIALQEELKPRLNPLTGLGNVVRQLQEERYAHAFRCLELLYDATCIAQLSGDEPTYIYLGTIFFDCFRVYIRPIRRWMEAGELTPGDKTFFVAESATSVPLSHTWSDRFKLRRSQEGQLHAPMFLQPALKKVFNTGKSVVVLKQLGRFQSLGDHSDTPTPEPPLDFESVCGPAELALVPFSELFSDAFDVWIQSKYYSTSSNLQTILFESCGLWTSLDGLQHIYLMSDGSIAEAFTSAVFTNLDALNTAWTDRFTLTELAQEAWSPCPCLETYRLFASVDPEHVHRDHSTARCSVRNSLPGVRLSYKLPWPVRLVITKESIAQYQSIFTFLLQLRRAVTVLPALSITGPNSHDHTDERSAYYGLRVRLLWFILTIQTYLTTLVLAPDIARMRSDLECAEDVDAMIEIHSNFTKRVAEEACLGRKLEPIKECMLDVLDLTIKLEDARQADEERRAAVASRLSSRYQHHFGTPKRPAGGAGDDRMRGLYVSPMEKEREEENTILFGSDDGDADTHGGPTRTGILHQQRQTYAGTLSGIRADFYRHLRFISGGLRGVARASTDAAASKWDILAEMLEMGLKDR